MEFTLDEFFAKGGVVSFMDRMAGVLGIHRADIKVVSIFEGSTIVEFQVLQRDEEVDGEELIDLSKLDKVYREFIETNEYFMDSRILSAEVSGGPIRTPYQQAQSTEFVFDWSQFEEGGNQSKAGGNQ